MHKPAQVELQLDWSQLPYSEYSGPSPQKAAQPNTQYKKCPYTGWKEKLLSNARKEVLIKAVAQAMPSYTMSCFKHPNTLCDELTGMVRQFWWGQVKDEKKLAWLSWEKMCLLKERCGMGFQDLRLFNLALLAKQGWRLQTDPSSLFYWVYKAKYFPSCDFVDADMGC